MSVREHRLLGDRRAPFLATITELRGSGIGAFGMAGDVGFFVRSCIGFVPKVGLEVWIYDLAPDNPEPRAESLYLPSNAPADTAELANAARAYEAAARQAKKARRDEAERRKREPDADDVRTILDELRALGAFVEMDKPASGPDIAAAEAKLGFALPADYRMFLTTLGGFTVSGDRSHVFYGLDAALTRAAEYADEFDSFRDQESDADGPYYPRRFVVVIDEGDSSNVAEGIVYDADLGGLLATDGGRYVSRPDVDLRGFWPTLIERLEMIKDDLSGG